jgi:hypothetical protein
LELGVKIRTYELCDFRSSDGLKRQAYSGWFYRQLDGEGNVAEKAVEEYPPHEEQSATA